MKFGIDFDDVLAPFVSLACDLCNSENGTNYTVEDINCWGFGGSQAVYDVSRYYRDERVFKAQRVSPQAMFFLQELMKRGDVYIITAVEGPFMSYRAEQIKDAFPELPESNIIMGSAKNLVKFDITLDDGPHNILKSCADYPVLMRRPWNKNLSGVLAVNDYSDFLLLVDQIKESMIDGKQFFKKPSIIALIGPSGARKHNVADGLEQAGYAIKLTSTNDVTDSECAAKTIYGRRQYAYSKEDIERILSSGCNVVCAVDIAGAMMLKRIYPVTLVFCKQSREAMFFDIVSNETYSNEEKAIRCTSMEQELKNESLCDFSIRTDDLDKAMEVMFEWLN